MDKYFFNYDIVIIYIWQKQLKHATNFFGKSCRNYICTSYYILCKFYILYFTRFIFLYYIEFTTHVKYILYNFYILQILFLILFSIHVNDPYWHVAWCWPNEKWVLSGWGAFYKSWSVASCTHGFGARVLAISSSWQAE